MRGRSQPGRLTTSVNQRALKCGDRSLSRPTETHSLLHAAYVWERELDEASASGGRGRHARWLAGRGPLPVELSGTDRGGHVLRLFTIDRAVLELDHRKELLPREPLQVGALSWARRSLHDLVVDALLV